MIKILFLIPTLGGGGAEKVLVNLVNNMDSTKFDITIKTLFDIGNNKNMLKPHINYKYIFKKQFRGNIHLFKIFSPEYLARKFIKKKYDIAVSYLEGPTTRIISGMQDSNTKKINWVHSNSTISSLSKSYRNIKEFKKSYNLFDCTLFVSETAKETFIKETGLATSNYDVIYNTIETNKIIDSSKENINDTNFNTNKMNLITVGKLEEVKGYDRLLNITKKLISEEKNIHLYILGIGQLESKITKYIKKNNLENHVTLLGYKNNPYKYVKQADLFVCASYSEGFSTAVTESLIVGTPVITTRVSGMTEILGENNEYGLVVDNETDSLYEGIKVLLCNGNLLNHYRNQTIERIAFFDTQRRVREVEKTFIELIKEKD